MRKRPVAALAGGVLVTLLCQVPAQAADGARAPHEVSGGYASWSAVGGDAVDVTVRAERPAVDAPGGRGWLPVTGGSATPAAGDVDVELAGALRLSAPGAEGGDLVLDELRLRLDGGSGTLYARAELADRTRRIALADVAPGASAPVLRSAGATWAGLRAALTAEGAELFGSWTGQEYDEGGALAPLDVTVGIPAAEGGRPPSASPSAPEPEPAEERGTEPEQASGAVPSGPPLPSPPGDAAEAEDESAPSASVAHPSVTLGGEQLVNGAGFAPGEVVLVAIDGDTRFDAVADASGRVSQAFPVYATAVEGGHAVKLDAVSGGRSATVEFTVRRG
ncbi:HtaA domain-containing protein [Streptomyces sp. CRN 30]|uniref:HtaA domain-containing protein n=1 Tax=Streptomyces sp. CRN 30 TaxID=3075613 RepID=UPI002A83E073|nr:HtaA domain-containing protein [Streptomyces sp. CRN 30]